MPGGSLYSLYLTTAVTASPPYRSPSLSRVRVPPQCRVVLYAWALIAIAVAGGLCVQASDGGHTVSSCGGDGLAIFSFIISGIATVFAFLGCTYGRQLMDHDYVTVTYGGLPGAAPTYAQPGQPVYAAPAAGGGYGATAPAY